MAEFKTTSDSSQSLNHGATPHSPDDSPESTRYRVKLIKGNQRWTFRWDPGCEAALIERVAQLAATPGSNLDWYDAAVVCKHIANPHRTSASGHSTAA